MKHFAKVHQFCNYDACLPVTSPVPDCAVLTVIPCHYGRFISIVTLVQLLVKGD